MRWCGAENSEEKNKTSSKKTTWGRSSLATGASARVLSHEASLVESLEASSNLIREGSSTVERPGGWSGSTYAFLTLRANSNGEFEMEIENQNFMC